jgi:hypothetical protein
VEELAAQRKKKQNLEASGIKQTNSFAILNSVDDDVLIQIAKALDISLASNDIDYRGQITTIKAEGT